MTTTIEVAQALVNAGYLTDADVAAAAAVLDDALIVQELEAAEADAMDDYTYQEDLIAKTEVWESEDAVLGEEEDAMIDEQVIAEASVQLEADRATVIEAEATIAAAYTDAAAALLAAELIDEADAEAVAAAIAEAYSTE
jgi:hypothetical protein